MEGATRIKRGGQYISVPRRVFRAEYGLQKKEKEREKVAVGPGSRERKAGYVTNKYGELSVRWKGLRA